MSHVTTSAWKAAGIEIGELVMVYMPDGTITNKYVTAVDPGVLHLTDESNIERGEN